MKKVFLFFYSNLFAVELEKKDINSNKTISEQEFNQDYINRINISKKRLKYLFDSNIILEERFKELDTKLNDSNNYINIINCYYEVWHEDLKYNLFNENIKDSEFFSEKNQLILNCQDMIYYCRVLKKITYEQYNDMFNCFKYIRIEFSKEYKREIELKEDIKNTIKDEENRIVAEDLKYEIECIEGRIKKGKEEFDRQKLKIRIVGIVGISLILCFFLLIL